MEFQESSTFYMDQYQPMEENQESKFLCNQNYQCGGSLGGGSMRSHLMETNSVESEEKVEPKLKKMSSLLNEGTRFFKKESKIEELEGQCSQGNYGLRENPKKTWRAVDRNVPLPQEKVCKQCGKVFQSMKALCGHMACHSEKERGGGNKEDYSWTSENHKFALDNPSDTESEEKIKLRSKSRSSNRFKRIAMNPSSSSLANNYSNASSSVSEIDEIEKEEVAVCLMMLSKDSISKGGGLNSVVESSDNNSVVLETKSLSSTEMRTVKTKGVTMEKTGDAKLKKNSSSEMIQQENSDSGYFLGDPTKREAGVSPDEIRRNAAYWECANSAKCQKIKGYRTELRKESTKENELCNGDEPADESYKRSKYECLNCKKSFKSYQALGGHRPCHKKINAHAQSKYESGENSMDANTVADQQPVKNKKAKSEQKVSKSKKQKGHVCPFCLRVFKSGQALGGHKRTHFIVGAGGSNGEFRNPPSPEINKPEVHDLFDLNLPAPVEDEDGDGDEENNGNVQFPSWY